MLNRDTILNAVDNQLESVEVPEWGGSVFVPVLSLDELSELSNVQKKTGNTNAMMAVQVIRDEHGKRVFKDEDATVLSGKPGSGKIILRILKKFNDVNGLSPESVNDAEKN